MIKLIGKEIFTILRSKSLFVPEKKTSQRKKGGKDQDKIQSSTTPDPGYHMGK